MHAQPAHPQREAAIDVAGRAFAADRSGALYWPAERSLIVADLHLEKGSAFAAEGRMLPPYDTRETLWRLAEVVARYAPATVVALGDSLHDDAAEARITPSDLELLKTMQRGRDWHWISGNHDPTISPMLGGDVSERLAIGGLMLQHVPEIDAASPEIAAHLHPVCKIVRRGQAVRRRCFVSSSQRLVMPAFGSFTGGLNVLDEAFAPLFPEVKLEVRMLGREAIYRLGPEQLVAD